MTYAYLIEWMDKDERKKLDLELRQTPGGGRSSVGASSGVNELMAVLGATARPPARRRS